MERRIQLASAVGINARSPSPIIPGAWPEKQYPSPPLITTSNSPPRPTLHERSITYPAPSVRPNIPLHLDRVLSFHRQLSVSLSADSPISPTPFSTSDSAFFGNHGNHGSIFASGDSGLTRFTRHDTSNTLSPCADASIGTIYTPAFIANPSKPSPQLSNSPVADYKNIERIHPSSNSISTPLSSDQSFQSIPGSSRASHHSDDSSPCITSSRPLRPRIVVPGSPRPSISLTATSPTSPASLISIADSSMTSLPSPIIFASPSSSQVLQSTTRSPSHAGEHDSPSRMQTWLKERQVIQHSHVPERSSEPVPSPFVIDFDAAVVTPTLSLPGTNSASPVPSSWTLSPISFTQTSPVSQSSSVLAPDYVQGLGLPGIDKRAIFPSSFCSPPFPSVRSTCDALDPASASEFSAEEDVVKMRTSAADYAAAVMSSAWGLVDSPEERLVLIDQEAVEAIEEADVAITERQDVQEVVDRGGSGSVEYLSRGTSTSAGIVDKMKRFGGRMRRLLKGENGRKGNVAQFSIDVDVVRGSEQRASVPAGAIPKARPSFSAQTYASSTPNPTPTQVIGTVPGINAPPMIHVTPPTHANPANRFRPNNVQFRPHVPAFPSPLPKPRPVSLSSLSRFQGGVPSSFSPESLVRHRARPRSSLPVNIEIDGFMPDVPVIRMNRRDTSGGPPGLPVPSPVPVLARDEASAKKKYRRFSLSALSSLVKGGDGDEN